ncbi:MAG: putative capsular polysaccharide synthesis family protein, partial [Pseudomonadota bacterium]|nr:putative capsular polysaccharide synthesis family protein [Pseudomonadota bacterium]
AKVIFNSLTLKNTPILILTMGKVASTSVHESLKAKVKNCGIYHIHFLSENMINSSNVFFKSKSIPTPYHIAISSALNKVNAKEDSKIITLVREPISRIVSDFFQNYKKYEPELLSSNKEEFKKNVLDSITKSIYEYEPRDNYETKWFDEEIVSNLGIDIYEQDFDYSDGYKIYPDANEGRLIIIRLEDLDECFSKAMNEFLNVNNVSMIVNNAGKNKEYSEIYDYIKANLVIPKSVCEKIYSTKYMRYFYSQEEINNFVKKWSLKNTGVC